MPSFKHIQVVWFPVFSFLPTFKLHPAINPESGLRLKLGSCRGYSHSRRGERLRSQRLSSPPHPQVPGCLERSAVFFTDLKENQTFRRYDVGLAARGERPEARRYQLQCGSSVLLESFATESIGRMKRVSMCAPSPANECSCIQAISACEKAAEWRTAMELLQQLLAWNVRRSYFEALQ